MSSNEKLKCRKIKAVLRYHVPNPNRNPEQYTHHLLFSFYPFRDEGNLKHTPFSWNYLAKLQQPEVLNVVNQNKLVMEPFLDFVDAALANVYQCTRNRHGTFLEQENDETEIEIRAVDIFVGRYVSNTKHQASFNTRWRVKLKIRSLNDKQRKMFDLVHG